MRYPCVGEALVRQEGTDTSLSGQLNDISLGGCYVDMMYPLPSDTQVELTIAVAELRLRTKGVVRDSREGFGMGIAFTEMVREDRGRLQELINWLSSSLGQGPKER